MQKDEGKKPEDRKPNPNKRRRSWNDGTKNISPAIKKKKKAPKQQQKPTQPNQLGFFSSAQFVPSLQDLQNENRKRTKRHYSTSRRGGKIQTHLFPNFISSPTRRPISQLNLLSFFPSYTGPSNQQQRQRGRNQSKPDLRTPRPTPGSVPDAPKGQSRYAMPSADPLETPTVALQQQQHGGNTTIGSLLPGGGGGILNAQNQQQATGLDLYGTNEGLILLHDESEDDDDDFDSSLEEADDEEEDDNHHARHRRRRQHYHHEAVQSGAMGDEHNPPSDQYDDDDDAYDDDDDDDDDAVGNGISGGREGVSPGVKHKRLQGRRIPPGIGARFAQYDAILAQWEDNNLRMRERLELVEAELAELRRRLDGGEEVGEQHGGYGGAVTTGKEAEKVTNDVGDASCKQ